MHNKLLVFVLVLAMLLPTAGLAAAQGVGPVDPLVPPPSAENGQMTDETSQMWFVEFTSAPTADGGNLLAIRRDQINFRNDARRVGLTYTIRYSFSTLWNGYSIQIAAKDVSKLSRIPSVKAYYPVVAIALPEENPVSTPDLATALAMTGADIAQNELGYTGAGIKVAVMDTGIDYDHPDLGGCFGPGCRVFTGWDFVGDDFDASNPANQTPVPDPDPDDCNGHGTHVAGIVGANGAVKGVAPDVTFGAYRVFGCVGSTFSDIMIAAMERAFMDGMQVLNMSIGSAFQWPDYPTAKASNLLVRKGMVVVASIGNSGANGLYSAGAPGLGKDVIGVASFDNSHINALTFNVNPSGRQVPYLPITITPDPPTSGTSEPLVWVGQGCNADPYLGDPNGKVALIVRGGCTFNEKYQKAFNAGAVGVVIHNNVPGLFAGGGIVNQGIFGIGISQADGLHIRGLLDNGDTVTLAWTDIRVNAPNPTGGLISSFSSYGLSPDLDVKPDIGAPGGLIRSTYPLELGGYAIISGTSMSSPHVAGAAALLLQAKPGTPANMVRTILQNSAVPKPWWGNPGLGFLDNVHRQGAGMLQIDDAILATTLIQPGKLALGEGAAGPQTRTLTLKNSGAADVTYDLSAVNALSTGGVITPSFFTSNATVAFSQASVTVPAGGTATVDVTITPATSPTYGQYGGYIVFTPQGDGQVYRVPFAGFVGDYQSIVHMSPTTFGFPWLARLVGTSYVKQSDGAVFTMQGDDIPYFLAHFDHQARGFRIEIYEAGTDWYWRRALQEEFLPRNSTTTSFYAFPFDGYTFSGFPPLGNTIILPDGEYYAVLQTLKALGDERNAADWETWTSPVFVIDRP